jgi:hypothetical protein
MNIRKTYNEQLEMFGASGLKPQAPQRGSKAWLALLDMVEKGPMTQKQWLPMGRGWRLAAAIKKLGYLGWPIESWWVLPEGCAHKIKCYRLPKRMLRFAKQCTRGGM